MGIRVSCVMILLLWEEFLPFSAIPQGTETPGGGGSKFHRIIIEEDNGETTFFRLSLPLQSKIGQEFLESFDDSRLKSRIIDWKEGMSGESKFSTEVNQSNVHFDRIFQNGSSNIPSITALTLNEDLEHPVNKIDILSSLDEESDDVSDPSLKARQTGCLCGRRQRRRIVGGRETTIEALPWMVQLVFRLDHWHFCGGSIINNKYVLTAAHCVEGLSPNIIAIRVGHTSSSRPGRIVLVESITVHGRYVDTRRYDIALIKLKEVLVFTRKIQPVCLSSRKNYHGSRGIISGWGDTFFGEGAGTDGLMISGVLVWAFRRCRIISKYNPEDLNFGVLCGRRRGSDTCQEMDQKKNERRHLLPSQLSTLRLQNSHPLKSKSA